MQRHLEFVKYILSNAVKYILSNALLQFYPK